MSSSAPSRLPDILCIGAAHWDVIGHTARTVRPGADLPGKVLRQPGGVAMNLALGLARQLPASATGPGLLAALGDDALAQALLALCAKAGIDTTGVLRMPGRRTDSYVAIEGADGLVAAIADTATQETAGAAILTPLSDGDWRGVAVIDGNLSPETLAAAAGMLGHARLCLVAASPHKARRLTPLLRLPHATLYANRAEAEMICGRTFHDSLQAAHALIDMGLSRALVTDGAAPVTDLQASDGPDGAVNGHLRPCTATPQPMVPRPANDGATRAFTGAGDRFAAAHIAAVIAGLEAPEALAKALAAASTPAPSLLDTVEFPSPERRQYEEPAEHD